MSEGGEELPSEFYQSVKMIRDQMADNYLLVWGALILVMLIYFNWDTIKAKITPKRKGKPVVKGDKTYKDLEKARLIQQEKMEKAVKEAEERKKQMRKERAEKKVVPSATKPSSTYGNDYKPLWERNSESRYKPTSRRKKG